MAKTMEPRHEGLASKKQTLADSMFVSLFPNWLGRPSRV